MKLFLKFLIINLYINLIFSLSFCTKSNKAPEEIKIDTSKIIKPNFLGKDYQIIEISNKIFLSEDTKDKIKYATSGIFSNSEFCPKDFIIPLKTDYENIINNLGPNAISSFTNKNGFNITEGKYYLTNTKGKSDIYSNVFMYLEGNSLKFTEKIPYSVNNLGVRCLWKLDSSLNFILPFDDRDLNMNEKITIKIASSEYMNGYLWKIGNTILQRETIEYKFSQSGTNMVEFWGKYINGSNVYLCDYIFVNKKSVSSSQTFSESQIKSIVTNITIEYWPYVNFFNSNCPIAPRSNGGYYIAVVCDDKLLHVLSYDKNDNLIKDFNTKEPAYPLDITSTDYGFAIYMKEVYHKNRLDFTKEYHSYLNLYNKNFELINTVQIMNNKENEDKKIDSNINKQMIKYDNMGSPLFGIRFIYSPDNGILLYSRGRIFLIFAHYNYFLDAGGHQGDTAVTFDEILLDLDFGDVWGSSHSLIQSATFDNNYFWTATLSDAYPEGIRVIYTSKKLFTKEYDSINKKFNSRVTGNDQDQIAGFIKGYHNGLADGKLGGILYFEKFNLYCLIYAKYPNYSNDEKNGTSIIFVSTWNFVDNQITNNKTKEIKISKTDIVMSLRAGKYGDDKIIIIYNETKETKIDTFDFRRNIPKGTIPKVFVITVPDMSIVINDKIYDELIMNTNEELRTFRDGVLIWGSANKDNKLVINKIGTPLLDDSYEDIDYIITKEEVERIKKEREKDEQEQQEQSDDGNNFLSTMTIIGIVGGVCGLIIIGIVIFLVIKCCKKNNESYYDNKYAGLVPGGF